jgi:putative transposase
MKLPPFFGQVVSKDLAGLHQPVATPDTVRKGVHEMGRTRKNHAKEFKAKVALEAVKGVQSLSELASRHKVHPTQIAQWKKHLVEGAPQVFERGHAGIAIDAEGLTAPLYQEIGRLKMELDFVQKKH